MGGKAAYADPAAPHSPEVPLLLGRLLLPEGAPRLADGAAAAAALPGAFAQLA